LSFRTGLDILIAEYLDRIQARRVGLVTHPAAVTARLASNVDALLRAGVTLTALFGPEHGLRGAAADGAAVQDTVDARTGIPVFSLYGPTKAPTPTMLDRVDLLLFDMQDVGVRFYTFMSTLFYVLQSAARDSKPLWVLDRPNPITGTILEGPRLAPEFGSFVGIIDVPLRHGLTLGELALYMNTVYHLGAELEVVRMRGWRRGRWFDHLERPWVPTSPAMPHLSTATVYPGMCLLEGTNVSAGRADTVCPRIPLPFEVCGAPWIDADALAAHLNALHLPGVRFRPMLFHRPRGAVTHPLCQGVQVHVTDREIFRPVAVGVHLLAALRDLYPNHFAWREHVVENEHRDAPRSRLHIDLLCGTDQVRRTLDNGVQASDIVADWESGLREFSEIARSYYLY
jgi:uncharacterized protein YbbC (DUF1343 family)